MTFWKSFGIFNEGGVTEAIRELSKVQDRRECAFAAATALIFYHERCRNIDQESIDTYNLTLDEREENASDKDLICCATFLWHTQQLKRAGQIVNKLIENNQGSLVAQTLKGWIYFATGKDDLQQKALAYFEQVLDEKQGGNPKQLEALLGRAKVLEKGKKYDECIQILSEITVICPTFQPAIIEKSKMHIQNGDWDQAIENITIVTVKDKQNVEALRLYCFFLLARENDLEHLMEKFDELIAAMKAREGRNADYMYNIARLFARFCGRRNTIIQKTLQILDLPIGQQPENAVYLTEQGFQRCMIGDFQAAHQAYQQAASYDETFLQPLYGMIYCHLK